MGRSPYLFVDDKIRRFYMRHRRYPRPQKSCKTTFTNIFKTELIISTHLFTNIIKFLKYLAQIIFRS